MSQGKRNWRVWLEDKDGHPYGKYVQVMELDGTPEEYVQIERDLYKRQWVSDKMVEVCYRHCQSLLPTDVVATVLQ